MDSHQNLIKLELSVLVGQMELAEEKLELVKAMETTSKDQLHDLTLQVTLQRRRTDGCISQYKAVTGVLFMNEASYKLWKTILGHREKALQELHKAIDTTTQQLRGATP